MSQSLDIPDSVYEALVEAARASGRTPIDWIAAQLPQAVPDDGHSPRESAKDEAAASSDTDANESLTERPWRGVFAPEYERPLLFTQEIDVRTAQLPEWEPHVIINPRWIADDDQ